MKASLYAIYVNQEWSWRVSLNDKVDQSFWFHRSGGKPEILQLYPLISWGQALWLQQWMNERSQRVNVTNLTEVRGELIKALKVVKANPDMLQKLKLSLWKGPLLEHGGKERKPLAWAAAMQGRALLPNEWIDLRNEVETSQPLSITDGVDELQEAYLQGRIELSQGVAYSKLQFFWRTIYELRCSRCGSGPAQLRWTFCVFCEGPCPYCEECLTMGRARFCTLLVQGSVVETASVALRAVSVRPLVQWGLNAAQTEAAAAGLQFLEQTALPHTDQTQLPKAKPCFLIWAVTGAGKTEMIYPLIEHELAQGRKVMIATPRKDVVLELMPRIQAAFPHQSVIALYGGSHQRWEQGKITLATTHQLLRFYQGFDLVILDELDAYPYHNNPMLEFAAQKACKPQGRFIYLSATPPSELQKSAKRNRLPHIRVPVRYHQHPLPVPKLLSIPPSRSWMDKRQIPAKLLHRLEQSLERGAQLFLFVSQIRNVEPLVLLLRSYFQDKEIQGTHSKDEERREKVVEFRQTRIDLLVTTTILERGITVAKTDVFVLDADAALFDEASLVQMAGRAGRSKDDPYGKVFFAAHHNTKAQVSAINQIKRMNAIAKHKGYFKQNT
jgi:competence protein ComFA